MPFGVVGSESKPGSKNGNGDGSGGKSASWGVKINCVLTSQKVLFNKMSSSVLGRCFKYSIAFIYFFYFSFHKHVSDFPT